jgi:hypothetical protein
MKKLLILLFIVFGSDVLAQCNSENISSECIAKFDSGFNFLKSFKIEQKGKEYIEHSYVFTKNTEYMINICHAGLKSEGIVLSLFDSNRNKVASSKIDGKFISAIAYPCNNTGIYYMRYTFEGPMTDCCSSALAFKRNSF